MTKEASSRETPDNGLERGKAQHEELDYDRRTSSTGGNTHIRDYQQNVDLARAGGSIVSGEQLELSPGDERRDWTPISRNSLSTKQKAAADASYSRDDLIARGLVPDDPEGTRITREQVDQALEAMRRATDNSKKS